MPPPAMRWQAPCTGDDDMNYYTFTLFLCAAFGVWKLGQNFDQRVIACLHGVGPLRQKSQELQLLQSCISELRGGRSLDQALLGLAKSSQCPPWFKNALPPLLRSKEKASGPIFLRVLAESLHSGAPSLEALQLLRQQTQAELRDLRKRDAIKAQLLAQALVISLLPWVFVLVLGNNFQHFSTLEMLLALLSFTLGAGGFFWLRYLGGKLDNPRSAKAQLLEKQLLPCLLQIQVLLKAGVDLEQALQSSLHDRSALKTALAKPKLAEISACKELLQRNRDSGAPIGSELRALMEDLQSQADARRERELQLLPLRSLLPLFTCSFPAALLSLAVLVLHSIRNFAP